jgi:hypothetical protein
MAVLLDFRQAAQYLEIEHPRLGKADARVDDDVPAVDAGRLRRVHTLVQNLRDLGDHIRVLLRNIIVP